MHTAGDETGAAAEALFAQLIDYAGLFPPAELPMAEMVANYATYTAHEDAWMLGRVIVPIGRLDDFEAAAEGKLPTSEDDEPWHVSGLTAPAGEEALAGHLDRLLEFNATHEDPANGLARVDVIELRGNDAAAIEAALDLMPDEVFPFFELPPAEDPRGLLATLVGCDAGAKIRTGGVTADLYPAPADVARFIHACATGGVPFKGTAGMHHPLRHHSTAVNTMEFGFINVFAAAVACFTHEIGPDEVRAILEEEDIAAFRFVPQGLAWREQRMTVREIDRARERFAVSFGSCSFDEPREDLRALGLLQPSSD
ncbi:MAG: hypothetical protein ACYTF9_05115 [Planctomycetota bacterium]|jgi:hypothetical protein